MVCIINKGNKEEKSKKKGTERAQKICVSEKKVVKSLIKSNQSGFCAVSDNPRKRLKILVSLVRFQLAPQKKLKACFRNENRFFSILKAFFALLLPLLEAKSSAMFYFSHYKCTLNNPYVGKLSQLINDEVLVLVHILYSYF